MATVYHAVQEGPHGFENHVALKLIHERLLKAHPRVVKMLVDEARVAARINHPNVLRILDLVEEANHVYMVMDFVDGISMRGVLDHARQTSTPAAIGPIIEVLSHACEGIHAAHQLKAADGSSLGLVHRDMKPGNIMVSIEGHVKVGDFGIALFADRVADSTAQGQLKGTPAYMAPEQTLGGPLDARSDVFSMGLTLYTLATNKLAFRARKAMQIALKIARESMAPHAIELESIAPGLGDVFRRACAQDPDERYHNALELGAALRKVHEQLTNPQSIPEMLTIAGWGAPAEAIVSPAPEPLSLEDSGPSQLGPPQEPIEGPEEQELTQTLGTEQDAELELNHPIDEDVDTNTYIPAVTELGTDLDSTPISNPVGSGTEPLLEPVALPEGGLPRAKPPPSPNPQVPMRAQQAGSFDPARVAAAAGPMGAARSEGDTVNLRHQRDFRGRAVPPPDPELTQVSSGEKLGIAITAVFLLATVAAIGGYQLISRSSKGEVDPITTDQSNTQAASRLKTNPPITEGKESGDPAKSAPMARHTTANQLPPESMESSGLSSMEDSPQEEELTIETAEVLRPPAHREASSPLPVLDPPTSSAAPKTSASSQDASEPPPAGSPATTRASRAATAVKQQPQLQPAATKRDPTTANQDQVISEPGLITVSSYPWSEVWIDDQKIGVIPVTEHSLPAGVHEVRLVFPGAGNKELIEKVEIRPGKHLQLVRQLNPEAGQTAPSKTP